MATRRNYRTLLGMGMVGLVCAAGAHGQHDLARAGSAPAASPTSTHPAAVAKRGAAPTSIPFVPGHKTKGAAASLQAGGAVTRIGASTGRYFVTLKQPSVVQHLAQSRAKRGDTRQPLSLGAAEAARHEAAIAVEQHAALASFERLLGRSVAPKRSFTKALNGFSLQVSEHEAALLAASDAVQSVQPVIAQRLHTDAGPALIGAPGIWDGSATGGVATLGEGVTVGIIDSGINADHPSFAETSGSYVHVNPFGAGVYKGWCATPENADFCNDKLIGAYDFISDLIEDVPDAVDEPSPTDNNGHGSHVAGTAAGNAIEASYHALTDIALSGVAPRANIIAYDTCYMDANTGDGWCPEDATASAVEQAIADGVVDVINSSIGGGDDPYNDFVSQAFLAATQMGIYIAASAGNDGPWAGTTSHQEPWVGTTAASTHGRVFGGTVAITGPGVPPEPLTDIVYVASSGVPAAAAIVSPLRDVASIAPGDAQGCSAYPEGALAGQVALVSRGSCAYSVKVTHAQAAGASAVVVYNNVPGAPFSMASLGDPSITIPAVMIEQSAGLQLAAFASSHPEATLSLSPLAIVETQADAIAGFSSRGPSSTPGVLKPDLAAPGVNVLAAVADGTGAGTPGTEMDVYSGTSMASPHHAGAVALLRALQPSWTPMQLKSALMLTAKTAGVVKEDGATPADALDHGSGRVQVAQAANAGLVMDETAEAFIAADPDAGGDPRALNLANLYSDNCLGTNNCVFERRFTNPHASAATWHITFEQPDDVTLSASSTSFTLQPGATATVTFTADATELRAADGFRFGTVVLTEESAAFQPLHMAVAIAASDGTLPDVATITTARDAGTHTLQGLTVPAVTDLTFVPSGLVRGTRSDRVLVEDSNPYDAFDDLTDGVWYTLVEPGQFGVRLVAEIVASEAVDLDLYVGQDLNDDGIPQADELLALSAGATALERVELRNLPADRNYWILVHSWIGSGNGPDAFTLSHAFVPLGDAGNLSVDAPATPSLGVPFDATLFFDEAQMTAGERWYGALDVGSDPDAAQIPDLGTIGVDVIRDADAVVKTADVAAASAGDVVTYTISVAPNASASDLAYSIVDTLPAGMTLVPGSMSTTIGTVAENAGTLTWTFDQAPGGFD